MVPLNQSTRPTHSNNIQIIEENNKSKYKIHYFNNNSLKIILAAGVIISQIGVAFLLFIVGLSLSPKVIKEVGKVSLITGIGQIIFTSLIGFFISRLLGFSVIVSLYIAIALLYRGWASKYRPFSV